MPAIYYNNLFEIDDYYRKKKFQELLLSSLKNDLDKWTQTFVKTKTQTRTRYLSPDYSGSQFTIDYWKEAYSTMTIAYVCHKTPAISELICDGQYTTELKDAIQTLHSKVYTSEIYEMEKRIGNQYSRKEKLDNLELEQVREIVDDTHKDWLENQNQPMAETIAKLIFSYRRNQEIFDLWQESFIDCEMVNEEYKKLSGSELKNKK